jgi:hypothetical protein
MAHEHGPSRDADRRLLLGALGLIVAFMAVEVVVGLLIDSLALLADAGHMLPTPRPSGSPWWRCGSLPGLPRVPTPTA